MNTFYNDINESNGNYNGSIQKKCIKKINID